MAQAETYPFDPDWVVPTSEVFAEWMSENGMTSTRVACAIAVPRDRRDEAAAVLDSVLNDEPLTERTARLLARVTGIGFDFWMAFERNYRSGLAAGRKVIVDRGSKGHD